MNALRQQAQLRQTTQQIPRLSCRLLALEQQKLALELGQIAARNPLVELAERALPPAPAREPTLAEHAAGQLAITPLDARVRADALGCLSQLDGQGRLPRAETLARRAGISAARAAKALQAIRRLDPPGIGAHDLADCMMLQLDALEPGRAVSAARRLVARHFEALASRRLDRLPPDGRDEALAVIAQLRPRFADQYAAAADAAVPDLEARRHGGVWLVRLLDDGPQARIAPAAQPRGGGSSWRECRRQARALVEALDFRRQTVLKVAQALADRQRGYFERGPGALAPVRLADIAADTGLSVSTVSAAVRDKLLTSPQGTITLKYLLQRRTGGASRLAGAALQEKIKTLVAAEDSVCPLSDQSIMHSLEKDNCALSRRTVAKHRRLAGVPPAHLRRQGR